MASIHKLTKPTLMEILESVPQRFWPSRKTRQDKAVIVEAIHRAHFISGPEGDRVRGALATAWRKRREAGLPNV